jgi:hypothetical protein
MEHLRARHRDRVSVAALSVSTSALAAAFVAGTVLAFQWSYRWIVTDVLLAVSAGLLAFSALALAGAWKGSAELRRASAIGALAWILGPLDWALREALNVLPCLNCRPPLWELAVVAAATVAALALVLGLAQRRPKARVMTIAAGWAGVTFFGMILAWLLASGLAGRETIRAYDVWLLAMPLASSALLVATLSGRRMVEHFAAGPRAGAARATLTAGATLNAAIAALLVFHGVWCWHDPLQAVTLSIAAVLGASAILTLRGRTAGLLLAVPGAVSAALLGLLVLNSSYGATPLYLPPFTLAPALLAALLGLAPLARPIWSFLQAPAHPAGPGATPPPTDP